MYATGKQKEPNYSVVMQQQYNMTDEELVTDNTYEVEEISISNLPQAELLTKER